MGDIYKFAYILKELKSKESTFLIIFADRFLGITGLLIFSLFNLVVGFSYFTDIRIIKGISLYFVIVILLYCFVFFIPLNLIRKTSSFIKFEFLQKLFDKIEKIRTQLSAILKKKFIVSIFITIIAYSLLILFSIVSMLSLNIQVDMIASFSLFRLLLY